MPEYGKYEKVPRPESIETFIRYLSSNQVVISIKRKGAQLIEIIREGKSNLKVFMTNIYIVGLADVYEILSEVGNVDAIVTLSAWNSYTQEAKEECRKKDIGLFNFKEFLGAVYYDGQKFVYYIHPDDR